MTAVSQNQVQTVIKMSMQDRYETILFRRLVEQFLSAQIQGQVFMTVLRMQITTKNSHVLFSVLYQRMQLKNMKLIIKLSYYPAINVSFQHNDNISHQNKPLIPVLCSKTGFFHQFLVGSTISEISADYNSVKIRYSSKQEFQLMYFSFWISCSER